MKKYIKLVSIFTVFLISLLFLFNPPSKPKAVDCTDINMGGDYTVSTSCAFSSDTNGVDNGNLTIATNQTLTVNAGQTIVWNPGKSITIQEGASIAISATGQLKKGYLWVSDSDGDGWDYDSTQVVADSQPAGYVRRKDVIGSVFGNGSDGSVTFNTNTNINSTNTISGRSCADGGDAVNYSVSAFSTNTATLSTTPSSGCLAVGNDILIINLQGDSTNYGNAGNYELLKVQNVSGNIITFTTDIKKIYGATSSNSVLTGQKILFQRVPQYSNATINDGVTVTGNTWDGIKGGVFAMKTSGTATINTGGSISMNEKGYRKGSNYGSCTYEYQGESYSRTGVSSNAANLGGGGGGWQENCGGDIWAGGGGGGGYGTAGVTGGWGTSGGVPGSGGGTYGSTNLSKIFLGSGGGAGGSYGGSPYGGNGGGIVIVNANAITVSGNITANGQNGLTTNLGGGGGGSGGSVLITSNSPTLGSSLVTAIKGNGGDSTQYVWRGDGGNGGDGRIAIYYVSSLSGTANPAAYSSQVSDTGGNIYLAKTNNVDSENPLSNIVESFKSFLNWL